MHSALITTKLHKPHPTANLVQRPRLIQRLDQGLRSSHRLFLIVAPAGYGKTTLTTEWLDKIGSQSAWLSLDDSDNDPPRFFTYLIAALQKTLGTDLIPSLSGAFPVTPQSPEGFILPLINNLSTVEQPILLVLDDYHLITSRFIQEAMVLLLRRAPSNLHLVVLTRVDPPFPLPRLRVRERITEIRDRDLRFTFEEMTTFLNSLHNLNLAPAQIKTLESHTEGWAAGLQLAALSLQSCSEERSKEFISAFSGSHHYIVDYLVEEVLGRQTESVREFLLQTSILERMCAPLCDAVWSRSSSDLDSSGVGERSSPSQEILEYLGHANLFLVPLDDERCWSRYHHLFIDVLRQMHKSFYNPDQIAILHKRASDWYSQNGLIAEAVHHTLQAGDHERAVEIVEDNAWSMVLHGELSTLKEWINALPKDLIARQPWLCIYYSWALLFSESEAAEEQLKTAEKQIQADQGKTLPIEIQGHIAAVRSWIAYIKGDRIGAADLSRQALKICPQMEPAVRCGLEAIQGDGYLVENDLPGAARAFTEARELARSSGNVMLEVISHAALGVMAVFMGRLSEAEAIYQEALQTAIRNKSPVAGQVYTDLARVYREWNDLTTVKLYAEKLIESGAMWGVVGAVACGHLYLAMILQAQGDIPGANLAIEESNRVMRRHSLENISNPWLGATRARLWLAQGRLEDVRHWVEIRRLSIEDKFDILHEIEYLTLVRILLAEGRMGAANRLLERLQGGMESTGRIGDLIGVLALKAMALHMQADTNLALEVLAKAIFLAREEGYVRSFIEAGKPLEPLLRKAVTQYKDRELVTYAQKLLAAFAVEGISSTAGQAVKLSILSERELQVLCLMAAGYSNKEIAEELVIAIGTAKRHTANIFDRLDVDSRTEAVAKARQLGLI